MIRFVIPSLILFMMPLSLMADNKKELQEQMRTIIQVLQKEEVAQAEIHDQDESDVVVADTVSFSQTDGQLSCNIAVLMPEEDVRQAVGEWLNAQLGNTYTGDMTDLQALVDYYGNSHLDSLRSCFEEGVPDFAEPCYDASMELLFETDKVVTYGLTVTLDLGGAHPVTRELGATFSKKDGKQLTWDIVRNDSQSHLRNILREMLKDYFNVKSDGELMDCLQGVDDVATIPMPTTPPYMTLEGFTLIYQQYEIATYAAGMPCDVIPYEQMKPCLTEYAQELIPEGDLVAPSTQENMEPESE